MKKRILLVLVLLIILSSFVSAGFFDFLSGKVSYDPIPIHNFYNADLSPKPLSDNLFVITNNIWTNKEPQSYKQGDKFILWAKVIDKNNDYGALLKENGGSVLYSIVSDSISSKEEGWKLLIPYTEMIYDESSTYYYAEAIVPKDMSDEALKNLNILVDISNGKDMVRFVGRFSPKGENLCGNGICEPFDEFDEGKNICPEDCPPSKYFVLFGGEFKTISGSAGETHLSLTEVRIDKVEVKENGNIIVIPMGVTEMLDGAFVRVKLIGTHIPEGAGTSEKDFYAVFEIVDEITGGEEPIPIEEKCDSPNSLTQEQMICMSNAINSLGLREKTLVCDADAFRRLLQYKDCTEQQTTYIAYSCVYTGFDDIREKLSECNLPEPIWMEPPRIEEMIMTTSGEEYETPFVPTSEKECSSGCLMSNGICVPFGTRVEGKYCDISKQFLGQKEIDGTCENSYECKSNECSDDKCISTYSLLEKILDFLKNLFKFK